MWAEASYNKGASQEEAHMTRSTALFVGIVALAIVSTVAEAADGCGRGWYYNGRRACRRRRTQLRAAVPA
jgi:hypothetical protein